MWGVRRLPWRRWACFVDAVGGGEDPGWVGGGGCLLWVVGTGTSRKLGEAIGVEAFSDVHQYPAQQIPTTPTRRNAGVRMVGLEAYAPDEVVWAGLGNVFVVRCRQLSP